MFDPTLKSAQLDIRPAVSGDAAEIAGLYLASRKKFLPWAPLAHTDVEVREWMAQKLIPGGGVMAAVCRGRLAGMVAASCGPECDWISHLYVHPSMVGCTVGSQLLRAALAKLKPPVRLYTFQANSGARRFYERHGFQPVAFSDGSSNEEHCPDVLYEFNPGPGRDTSSVQTR